MFLALLALLPGAEAATLTVCPGGTCDFDDLNAAIDSASSGDEIVVGDGNWTVNRGIDKDLTVRGQNPGYAFLDAPDGFAAFELNAAIDFTLRDVEFGPSDASMILDSNAAANVTMSNVHAIDHNPEGHLIKMRVGGTLDMDDCDFTGTIHGYAVDGAVLWMGGGAVADLNNVTISGASAYRGGAIFVEYSTLTFGFGNISASHSVLGGGAIYVGNGGVVSVDDSFLSDNTTDGDGGHVFTDLDGAFTTTRTTYESGIALEEGGAIHGVQDVDECEFLDNHATRDGGAVYTNGAIIEKSTFTGNSGENGGAIRFTPLYGALTVQDCTFDGNDANGDPTYFRGTGGAILAYWGGDVDIRYSVFTGNTSTLSGGAVYHGGPGASVIDNCLFQDNATQAAGGAFARFYTNVSRTEVHRGTFIGNTANDGGAIQTLGSSDVQVSRSVFCDNEAIRGGGALSFVHDGGYATVAEVNNSVFSGNITGQGAAIMATPSVVSLRLQNNDILDSEGAYWGAAGTARDLTDVDIRNNLFAWSSGAPAWYAAGTVGTVTQDYNAWWANAGGDLGGTDAAYGDHAVTTDPMLTDYTPGAACGSWDLTPLPGSPLIDGGDPSWTDSDGSTSDIGITGGVDGTSTPGYIPSTGTGSGTGTSTGTATGAGGTTTGSWSAPLPQPGVDQDGDGHSPPWDCDDHDPRVHPDATEIANDNKDNDCDGRKLTTWLGGRACSQGTGSPAVPGLVLLTLLALSRRRD